MTLATPTLSHASTARVAVYYAPPCDSGWWRFGAHWLGRDDVTDAPLQQPVVAGCEPAAFHALTQQARRYGFHATLRSPFTLADGASLADLHARLRALAATQAAVPLGPMDVVHVDGFIALRPRAAPPGLAELEAAVLDACAPLLAPLTDAEIARRRAADLTPAQDALLLRDGYPYVRSEFRFHLTLTDRCSAEVAAPLRAAAARGCADLQADTPLVLDRLVLFHEAAPGAAFVRGAEFVLGGG
jgi:hypothetical protein